MKMLMKLTAALSLSILAGTAQAATFKFDGNGSSNNQSAFSYTEDGLTVVATAGKYSTPGAIGSTISLTPTTIDMNGWGLISKRHKYDEHVVDGKNGNEVILFDFGAETVTLTGARFRYTNGYNFSSHAKFDFFADGVFIGQSKYADAASIFDGVAGSVFGIGASNWNTGFKLAGISAEVSAVPLPATGLMLLTALAGAGAVSRRRRKAA